MIKLYRIIQHFHGYMLTHELTRQSNLLLFFFCFVVFWSDFTIQPSDQVVAVGKPLLLNCQAQYSGSGTVHISWSNNGDWLLDPTNQPWTQLTNHSLHYNSIPAQSIGTFICGASVAGTKLIIYSRTANVQAACKSFVSNYRYIIL